MKAESVLRYIKKLGSPQKSKSSARFFKTGKGQYGEGDIFFGVTVPEQRGVAKKYKDLPLPEIQKLINTKVHECRLTALIILVAQYEQANQKDKEKIYKFYLKNSKKVNNWDLVDSSAPYIVGDFLLNKDRSVLYKLANSKNLWEKRISIVSTMKFISKGDFRETLEISKILFGDKEDLIHKAVGWMLREVGKKSEKALDNFLKKHGNLMPRTSLRYSIEKFSKSKRKYYLLKK